MRRHRSTSRPFLVVASLLLGLSLAACSSPAASGPSPGGDTATPGETTKPTPSGEATAAPSTGAWEACPAIVASLNGNASDPSDYAQIGAKDFGVAEVGSDVLERACVIGVTVGGKTVTWAILPGDAALAESIMADLLTAGFAGGGALPAIVGNQSTGLGALIVSVENGAALDAYLVYTTAFAPYAEPLVYVGAFALG